MDTNRTAVAFRIAAAIFLMACIVASSACQRNDNVTYEVTGDAESVDITLTNSTGDTEQYNDVPLPFRMDYGGHSDSDVYLYAYNRGESGSINLKVYVNGKLFKSAYSSGPYVNAVVTGTKDRSPFQ
jgi:hypothetical protein